MTILQDNVMYVFLQDSYIGFQEYSHITFTTTYNVSSFRVSLFELSISLPYTFTNAHPSIMILRRSSPRIFVTFCLKFHKSITSKDRGIQTSVGAELENLIVQMRFKIVLFMPTQKLFEMPSIDS